MARPRTKVELQQASQQNFTRLLQFIADLSEDKKQASFPEGYLNRNVRDVVAHLHHWHLLFQRWYNEGMKGEKPAIPAPGFTWKTTPELNRTIRNQYAEISLEEALTKWEQTHRNLQYIIDRHSDEELFEKKRYPWTGSTSLGAYLISATASHYDWALKLIRKCLKNKS